MHLPLYGSLLDPSHHDYVGYNFEKNVQELHRIDADLGEDMCLGGCSEQEQELGVRPKVILQSFAQDTLLFC